MIVNMNEKRTLDDVYVSTHTFIAYTNITILIWIQCLMK